MKNYNEEALKRCAGRTAIEILGAHPGSNFVSIRFDDGSVLTMDHTQDCCEHVRVEEVIGDLTDLTGTPIVSATESVSRTEGKWDDSATATWYTFQTKFCTVTFRWLGESNGFYSEAVNCYLIDKENTNV